MLNDKFTLLWVLISICLPMIAEAADMQQLEDQIVSLSGMEQAELIKKLEQRLGVVADQSESPKEQRVEEEVMFISPLLRRSKAGETHLYFDLKWP